MIATVTLNPSLDEWMELPSVRVGALNRATHFARYPGGKGINVSRVIRELGGRTVAFGLAGGADGMILRHLLNRQAIPHEFVEVRGVTRNNYKIRTRRPSALTEINGEGPRVSSASLRALAQRLFARPARLRCVVLSGSLPPGASPMLYRRWIHRLNRLRIPTVLDASGAALRQGLAARPWFIKPNRQEAEELVGRTLSQMTALGAAARWLLDQGPSVVVISLGKDGALMAVRSPSGVWLAKSPVVRARGAVGAGDSLIGGFLMGWMKGRSLLEAFRLGVACGTATAMRPGTELCHRADAMRLFPRVSLRRLA